MKSAPGFMAAPLVSLRGGSRMTGKNLTLVMMTCQVFLPVMERYD
jgi:hypothetical protein